MDNEKEIRENINTDIFEETDSNLEEQTGVETVDRDNGIPLPIGEALIDEALYKLSSKKDIDLVCILGPVACGKTTFEAMLYSMFLRQVNDDVLFSGSETIVGFENLLNYVRINSGQSRVDMPRTPKEKRDKFYHLELLNKPLNEKQNLILADVAGELFETCKANRVNLEREVPFLDIAKNIAIFIDGEKLLDISLRHSALFDTRSILKTIKSSRYFKRGMNIDIIISKNDEIVKKKDDAKTMSFIESIEDQFKAYKDDFNIKVFHIQALNDYCAEIDESSTSLINMLKYWLTEKESVNDKKEEQCNCIQVKSCFNRFMEMSYE